MKNFFLGVWKFLSYIFPYILIVLASLYVLASFGIINKKLNSLQAQLSETELNQANNYSDTLLIESDLAQGEIILSKKIDQAKIDAINQNNVILKTVYAVDKNSNNRDQGIVDGVNQVVKDVSYALQKPSYDYLKNVTVKIIGKNKDENALPGDKGWMGTGVIIAIDKDYTYILTCRHVVEDADHPYDPSKYDYYVKDGSNHYTITPIKVSKNPDVDLALIRINGKIDSKVAVVGFGTVKEQDPVYMVGMDLGRPFFYSEGTVAGFDPQSDYELVVGMPSGPGNSGSGIINKDGQLVGILYAGSVISEATLDELDISHGLCVPIKAIRLFLAGYIEE